MSGAIRAINSNLSSVEIILMSRVTSCLKIIKTDNSISISFSNRIFKVTTGCIFLDFGSNSINPYNDNSMIHNKKLEDNGTIVRFSYNDREIIRYQVEFGGSKHDIILTKNELLFDMYSGTWNYDNSIHGGYGYSIC